MNEKIIPEQAVARKPVYVASRASIEDRSLMWLHYREERGYNIVASWIDEAGPGETGDFGELWDRIKREIASSVGLVLYAEQDDFPLKGALIEVGIALGMGKPVIVCLPGVVLDGRTHRPIGSWIEHRRVTRIDDIEQAMRTAAALPLVGVQRPEDVARALMSVTIGKYDCIHLTQDSADKLAAAVLALPHTGQPVEGVRGAALIDRAFGEGMQLALKMASQGAQEAARELAERWIEDGRKALSAAPASPRAEGELTPHPYVPSTLHMGDCAACGHLQSAAVHSLVAEKRES